MPAVSKASKSVLHGAWIVGLVWLCTVVAPAASQSQSPPRSAPSVDKNRPCGDDSTTPPGQPPPKSSPKAPPSRSAPRPAPSVDKSRPCGDGSTTSQSPSPQKPATEADRDQKERGSVGAAPPPTAPQPYIYIDRRPYPEADRGRRVGDEPIVLPSPFSSWRPYTNDLVLVTLGMTKAEVMLKAGNPAFEEVISQGTDGYLTLSTWTYVRTGYNASITTLTFQGGKLVRIESKLAQ